MRIRIAISVKVKGKIGLMTVSKGIWPMLQTVNKEAPRGGVIKPMTRFNIMIIPKWRE